MRSVGYQTGAKSLGHVSLGAAAGTAVNYSCLAACLSPVLAGNVMFVQVAWLKLRHANEIPRAMESTHSGLLLLAMYAC